MVQITFEGPTFDVIPNDENCKGDFVKVAHDSSRNNNDGLKLNEKICGSNIDLMADPTFGQINVTAFDEPFYIQFKSNKNDEGTGFKAKVCCIF